MLTRKTASRAAGTAGRNQSVKRCISALPFGEYDVLRFAGLDAVLQLGDRPAQRQMGRLRLTRVQARVAVGDRLQHRRVGDDVAELGLDIPALDADR